jgi:hypothetical protein
MGKTKSGNRVFVGKPEGKRKIGRRKRRWENIKMHFQEIKVGVCELGLSDPGLGQVHGIS